ncbi:MAG: endolytic transglycosylase MltG [Porticoccaceae bacterium]
MLRRLILILLLGAIASVGIWKWADYQLHRPLAIAPATEVLVIERGERLSHLSARLSADGILSFALPLRLYVRFSGRERIHPGDYRLVPGDTALGLLEKLERGDVIRYSITFPEGRTLTQWRALLAKERLLVPLTRTLSAADLAADLGIDATNPEGWFSPNTYFFVAGDSDRDILLRAHRRLRDELDNAWRDRSAGLPYATPYEALIAASLVERETGLATERAQIAGVLVRRLQTGMRLQIDSTVIYGLGERYVGKLSRAHLTELNDYNTYMIAGLPPTPIANPGTDALRAALHPAPGNTLYFVARGDGSHQFSASLAEHQRSVRKYQLRRVENYRSTPEPREDARR